MSDHESQETLYSLDQVDRYLSRILFPIDKWPRVNKAAARSENGLEYLRKLQKYQLATVPFENLSLHYTNSPMISLNKDDLYEKIVERGRGGYCMELNFFFATILKTLGYKVIQIGARVFGPSGDFGGWGHQLNLVLFENQAYAVDVGFGSQGPTQPLSVISGAISTWGSTNVEMRLTYEDPKTPIVQGCWYLEHKFSDSHDWKKLYTFSMTEFFPKDYEVMNFATSNRKTSWFTQEIVCTRMILDEKTEDIIGTVTLSDKTLKKRILGQSELLDKCSSEEKRLKILEEHFGVVLSKKEREGVRGTAIEVKEVGYFADH